MIAEFDEKAYLKAGTITTTHGLKGEVKVFPLVDDPGRFSLFTTVFLKLKGKTIKAEVENVKFFKKLVILKLKGFDDVDESKSIKGFDIYAKREEIAELKEGQYFDEDLINLPVYDEEGTELGVLDHILHSPGNDVFVIKNAEGKEILIPAVKQFILSVDIENGRIIASPLPGML